VVVVGNGRSHPVALVAPNWPLIRDELWLSLNDDTTTLAARPDVLRFMQHEVAAQTADLARFEQIRYVAILPHDLTIEAGELSPTLKVRRRIVENRYANLIDELYKN
jgi:long-chain acyl-CoA synthetase